MEFEAVDEGRILSIAIPAGSEGVKVGTVIALIGAEDDAAVAVPAPAPAPEPAPVIASSVAAPKPDLPDRIKASPLARRIAIARGIDLASLHGTGPGGRIVKADLIPSLPRPVALPAPVAQPAALAPPTDVPYEAVRLSGMRKTIARRLAESKQTVPHFYLTVDARIDALLALRADLNASLEGRGIRLSVNDLLIRALGVALVAEPDANVQFAGDELYRFARVDVSVAVAVDGGLVTPIVRDAGNRSVSAIAIEMRDLAARARDGKLRPEDYQGGTVSLSNLGMYGIREMIPVINPPQALILGIGAGEKRPVITDGAVAAATVMSVTGSFDHRAIDGAAGARFMQAFKDIVEAPLSILA
jgi:pyruvate dehydrogenase E2 component (dihydrolipoamide acetyltransferase)